MYVHLPGGLANDSGDVSHGTVAWFAGRCSGNDIPHPFDRVARASKTFTTCSPYKY